jgi:hypothetical protein
VSGETDLDRLVATLSPHLQDGVFVFVTLPPGHPGPTGCEPLMRFNEAEGATLILTSDEAQREGLDGVFPCRQITLTVHSSLAAVGFMAKITTALAAAGIGVNPVSGYFHDHLFVPLDRAEESIRILKELAGERSGPAGVARPVV